MDEDKFFGIGTKISTKKRKEKKLELTQENLNRAQRLDKKQQIQVVEKSKNAKAKLPLLRMTNIEYTMMSRENAEKIATHEIKSIADVNSPLLGVVEFGKKCAACKQTSTDCWAHMGIIYCPQNMAHPSFRANIVYTLQSVCRNCAKMYLHSKDLRQYKIHSMSGLPRLKKIAEKSKGKICLTCRQVNTINFVYTKNSRKDIKWNIIGEDKKDPNNKKIIPFSPNQIKKIFHNISKEDLELLGYKKTHPENFIQDFILITPPALRPKLERDGIEHPNNITVAYTNILESKKESEATMQMENSKILLQWLDLLEGSGVQVAKNETKAKPFALEMKGKDGIMRKNLLGKRNDFSARTVLGPSETVRYGNIILPNLFGNNVSVSEYITRYNLDKIKELATRGMIKSVFTSEGNEFPSFDISKHQRHLIVGNMVRRVMLEGDVVMFSRQPILHKHSLVGYNVQEFNEQPNIQMHLASTGGHNADFDGDEGNIYVLQTTEAKVEARTFTSSRETILSPYKYEPSSGLSFNAIVGAYLLSKEDVLTVDCVNALYDYLMKLATVEDAKILEERFTKLKNPTTGPQIISLIFPPNFIYDKEVSDENYLTIRMGVIQTGYLSKASVGASSGSIPHILAKQYSVEDAAFFLTYGTFMFAWYSTYSGITISIKDIIVNDYYNVKQNIKEKVEELNQKIISIPELPPHATQDEHDIRNSEIVDKLNKETTELHKEIDKYVDDDNPIVIMSKKKSGSKSKKGDMAKIAGIFGQNFPVNGLLPDKDLNRGKRCLATFSVNDKSIYSRGFVVNSYFEGMNLSEYVFQLEAARVGLIDTAVKTGDVGDIQRKMIKSYEDLIVDYDGSIKNQIGMIYQFNQNFNPSYLLQTQEYVSFIDLEKTIRAINYRHGYDSMKMRIEKLF